MNYGAKIVFLFWAGLLFSVNDRGKPANNINSLKWCLPAKTCR